MNKTPKFTQKADFQIRQRSKPPHCFNLEQKRFGFTIKQTSIFCKCKNAQNLYFCKLCFPGKGNGRLNWLHLRVVQLRHDKSGRKGTNPHLWTFRIYCWQSENWESWVEWRMMSRNAVALESVFKGLLKDDKIWTLEGSADFHRTSVTGKFRQGFASRVEDQVLTSCNFVLWLIVAHIVPSCRN